MRQEMIVADQYTIARVIEAHKVTSMAWAEQHLPRLAGHIDAGLIVQEVSDRRAGLKSFQIFVDRRRCFGLGFRHTGSQEQLQPKAQALRSISGPVLYRRLSQWMGPDLGAARLDEALNQPVVIGMGVRNDDALEILNTHPKLSQPSRQCLCGIGRMRSGIDQRQRIALEKVGMDGSDGDRSRQRDTVDSSQDGCIKGVDGNGTHRLFFFALDQDGPGTALDNFVLLIAHLDLQRDVSAAQPWHRLQL